MKGHWGINAAKNIGGSLAKGAGALGIIALTFGGATGVLDHMDKPNPNNTSTGERILVYGALNVKDAGAIVLDKGLQFHAQIDSWLDQNVGNYTRELD